LKAVRIYRHGGVDQLRYEDAAEPPLRSPQEVLVRLRAASVNPIDIATRSGRTAVDVSFPHILGCDGAGTVLKVGEQVKNVKPGDAVCIYPAVACARCEFCIANRDFMCSQPSVLGERENGTYAECVGVPAQNCYPIPAGLTFAEAAAFPLVFMTLWRMLMTNAGLRPGESVLIVGIGCGVTTAALQLAANIGARIIVTSSSDERLALAKNYGAEYAINSRATDFAKEVRNVTRKRGVDVVVDCVGGDDWGKCLAALARGGRIATCGATAGSHPRTDIRRIFWNHLKIFGSTFGTREEFQQVLNFMEGTRTKPILDRTFALKDTALAHRRVEEGEQFGQVILRMDD
jgi:NADPH:quinone reductase-like Zn-dependent oxidoreductase